MCEERTLMVQALIERGLNRWSINFQPNAPFADLSLEPNSERWTLWNVQAKYLAVCIRVV